MKSMYVCAKCKQAYSGDGRVLSCPSCGGKLAKMTVSVDKWRTMSDDEKQKEKNKTLPKKMYLCPKCKSAYSGDGSSVICPSCGSGLKNMIVSQETWEAMSDDEKQKEIDKCSSMPDARETKQNVSGYLPSKGRLYYQIVVGIFLLLFSIFGLIYSLVTGHGEAIAAIIMIVVSGSYVYIRVKRIQEGLYKR